MAQAITVMYAQDNDDWSITVAGLGEELTARAPGIIAARDRADQLVEQLAGADKHLTVVHLLNGSALEFTSAYMTARLTRSAAEPDEATEPAGTFEPEVPAQARTESAPASAKSRKRAVPTKELAKNPDEVPKPADKGAESGEPVGKSGRRDTRRKVTR